MIRAILVDDDKGSRGWIPLMLKTAGISIVALAENGDEAIACYKNCRPNVAILDLQMPRKDGLLAAKDILRYDSQANIVIYSAYLHSTYISLLKEMGVLGFVRKSDKNNELIAAVRSAACREVYYSVEAVKNILPVKDKPTAFDALSHNERIITLLLSYHMSLTGIASAMHIEEATAAKHKYNAFKKMKINSLDELYLLAMKNGFYTIHIKKAA